MMNKFIKYSVAFIFTAIIMLGCAPSDKDKLAELKKKQKELTKEIEQLEKKMNKGSQEVKAKLIEIDTLKIQPFHHYIEVQGAVDADENVFAAPPQPGVVTAVYVNEGDRVSKGQVMARMDGSTLEKGMEEVRSGLAFATTAYEKQKRLWEQNIGSEMQYLAAKNQKEQLENKLKTLQAQMTYFTIKAPVTGTVDEVKVKIGEMASPGYFGIRVINFSKLSVKAKLSDAYIGKIKAGDMVKLFFPDINKTIESKVTFVSNTVDPQSRTITVEAKLNNSTNDFKPNMISKLLINDGYIKNALVVPTNVVQSSGGNQYVFVASPENGTYKARKKEVTSGETYSGQTVITSGLTENDLVITFGFSELQEGQVIKF